MYFLSESRLQIGYNWNGPRPHLSPWLFWSMRNLVPKKLWPQEVWSLHENNYIAFSCRIQLTLGPNFSGPNFLGDQISWDQVFRRPKKQEPKRDRGPFFYSRFCSLRSLKKIHFNDINENNCINFFPYMFSNFLVRTLAISIYKKK